MADKRTRLSDMTKAGRKAEKPTVIGAIRDPQFVRDVLQGLGETATRGITGVLGAPVDITTMAMRPFGYSVPAEQVVGGSEYLGKQLERAGMLSGNRNQLSELLAGLVTPDPLDVAKLGAMAVPVVGRVARQAPRDEAMRIAQANAAKPISEGGLGLPPDNTAMDRAKAMGFDLNVFHGSDKDIQELKKYSTRGGLGSLYVSDEPKTPNEYAMLGAQLRDLLPEHLKDDVEYLKDFYGDDLLEYAMKTQKVAPQRSPNVLPLMARSENAMSASDNFSDYGKYINTEYPEAIKQNWEDAFPVLGNDAYLLQNADPHLIGMQVTGDISDYTAAKRVPLIKFLPDPETGTNTFVIQDPSNIRSRFAAFDPARRYESDLLGAADPRLLGAIGLGTAGAIYKTNREKEKDRKREK